MKKNTKETKPKASVNKNNIGDNKSKYIKICLVVVVILIIVLLAKYNRDTNLNFWVNNVKFETYTSNEMGVEKNNSSIKFNLLTNSEERESVRGNFISRETVTTLFVPDLLSHLYFSCHNKKDNSSYYIDIDLSYIDCFKVRENVKTDENGFVIFDGPNAELDEFEHNACELMNFEFTKDGGMPHERNNGLKGYETETDKYSAVYYINDETINANAKDIDYCSYMGYVKR